MKIDADLLLQSLEERRAALGELRGGGPLTWLQVGAETGTHSSTFTRLKDGRAPGRTVTGRLMKWLNRTVEEFAACTDCDEPECEEPVVAAAGDDDVAGIYAVGQFSTTNDPDTIALIGRARELIREGAVGVSIRYDYDPADMPSQEQMDQWEEEDEWDKIMEALDNAHFRPRHIALVDTAAFSNARLTVGEDGTSLEGYVAFEGLWTGDLRSLPLNVLKWDDDLLPIAFIWDREEGDHSGAVIGSFGTLERHIGVTASVRGPQITAEQVEAITAAAGDGWRFPAAGFTQFTSDRAIPLTFEELPGGMTRVYGHVAPRGVCHRSNLSARSGGCWTYPGDVDGDHAGYHTGANIQLDDGTHIRVGALTIGGGHIDPGLARNGVKWSQVDRHREDANQVVAMTRAWDTQHGLAISGILMPDVDEATRMRMLACAPSVELWPRGGGYTLVGLHLVPQPALPVVASTGPGGEVYLTTIHQEVLEEQEGLSVVDQLLELIDGLPGDGTPVERLLSVLPTEWGFTASGPVVEAQVVEFDVDGLVNTPIAALTARVDRFEQILGPVMAEQLAAGIPNPE